MNKTRAKNLYRKADKLPKTSFFFGLGYYLLCSVTGKKYTLYHRGRPQHFKDIPVGELDIGILHNKFFIRIGSAHPDTKDLAVLIKNTQDTILRDDINLERKSQDAIERWAAITGNKI